MGGAFAEGLLASPDFKAEDLTIANPHEEKLLSFATRGASVTTSNTAAIKDADVVVLAVKPWVVPDVVDEIMDSLDYTADHRELCSLSQWQPIAQTL